MRALLLNAGAKSFGATQEILSILQSEAPADCTAKIICLGERDIGYCLGCKVCYETGRCVRDDDVGTIMDEMDAAEVIVIAAPSYWADVPGQFKVFIDRCTAYGDTNPNPDHRTLRGGKSCYAVALRAGSRPMECEHIIETVRHWCGHMKLELTDSLYFCGINGGSDIVPYRETIVQKAREWLTRDKESCRK